MDDPMDFNIGHKIMEYRKKLGFTQEKLANCLDVSIAAVSKWESGNSYPDITLLPQLALLFHVSIDNLFDFDLENETLEEIMEKGKQYEKEGNDKEGLPFLFDALKKYPNDFELNRLVASMLLHKSLNSTPVDKERAIEAIKYFDKCLLLDVDEKNKDSLIQNKSFILGSIGEYEKANELLMSLKNDRYTVQIASNLLKMGRMKEAKERLQMYLNDLAFSFAWLCDNLAKCFEKDHRNKEIYNLWKMNAAFREHMAFNDTPNYFDFLSSRDYLKVAKEAKKNHDSYEMWQALEKSVYHAVKFDNNPSFVTKDVNFLYDYSGYYNNGNVLASDYILKTMQSDFAEFSNDEKYRDLINLLGKQGK